MTDKNFITQKVTLTITVDTRKVVPAAEWDFHDLLGTDGVTHSLHNVQFETIPTDLSAVEDMKQEFNYEETE